MERFRGVECDREVDDNLRSRGSDDYVRSERGAVVDPVDTGLMTSPRDSPDYLGQDQIVTAANRWKIGAAMAGNMRGGLDLLLATAAHSAGSGHTERAEEGQDAKTAAVDEAPFLEGEAGVR